VRILELITLGEIGGAQTVLVDLLKGFSERNYSTEIDVVCGAGNYLPHALSSWFKGNVIQMPCLTRNINPYQDIKTLLKLKKLFEKRRYDIVHCHSSKASWLGRLAASWAGAPRISMTVHGLSFRPGQALLLRKLYKMIEKITLPLASDYIFVSPADMEEMQAIGLKPAKCKLISNGRPVPPRQQQGLRQLLPIPQEAQVICMVARLARVKNPLVFVRIAKNVIKRYPEGLPKPIFVLVGDGPMLGDCRAAVNAAGLKDYVYLLGHREEAAKYFWDANIALLTSEYEACPLVLIEAMAAGTPVVATDTGGTGYLVKHGETGYLYSLNAEEEAADYVIELLKDQQLKERMSIKALKRYQKEFSVELMIDRYATHFGVARNSEEEL